MTDDFQKLQMEKEVENLNSAVNLSEIKDFKSGEVIDEERFKRVREIGKKLIECGNYTTSEAVRYRDLYNKVKEVNQKKSGYEELDKEIDDFEKYVSNEYRTSTSSTHDDEVTEVTIEADENEKSMQPAEKTISAASTEPSFLSEKIEHLQAKTKDLSDMIDFQSIELINAKKKFINDNRQTDFEDLGTALSDLQKFSNNILTIVENENFVNITADEYETMNRIVNYIGQSLLHFHKCITGNAYTYMEHYDQIRECLVKANDEMVSYIIASARGLNAK